MSYKLSWLADVLRSANLTVVEEDNWKTRGHGDMGDVKGVICHHTAGPRAGNAPSLAVVRDGRPGLSGPLAQLFLARDGTYHIVAAGRAYHAGPGKWQGITSGNSSFIGIEAENTGLSNDQPWPSGQMDAYARGVAAILKKLKSPASMCCGHKEYATPKGRKIDPTFDMVEFRSRVAAILGHEDKTYTVVGGDTLFAIAKKHGTSVTVLAGLNSLVKPFTLSIGQVLHLP